MTARIAVFASGRGSNLQALHAYLERAGGAEVVLVASDRASSGALAWARDRGIASSTIESGGDDATTILELLSASTVSRLLATSASSRPRWCAPTGGAS